MLRPFRYAKTIIKEDISHSPNDSFFFFFFFFFTNLRNAFSYEQQYKMNEKVYTSSLFFTCVAVSVESLEHVGRAFYFYLKEKTREEKGGRAGRSLIILNESEGLTGRDEFLSRRDEAKG